MSPSQQTPAPGGSLETATRWGAEGKAKLLAAIAQARPFVKLTVLLGWLGVRESAILDWARCNAAIAVTISWTGRDQDMANDNALAASCESAAGMCALTRRPSTHLPASLRS